MVYPVGLLCMYMCKCVYIYDGYPLGLHVLMLIRIISYGYPIGLLILWYPHEISGFVSLPCGISARKVSTFCSCASQDFPAVWGFPYGGTHKWMVCFMENPSINGWFRDTPHDKTETSMCVDYPRNRLELEDPPMLSNVACWKIHHLQVVQDIFPS